MSYIFDKSHVIDFTFSFSFESIEKGEELFYKYCPYCQGGSSNDESSFSINLISGTFFCFRSTCGKSGHFVELARDFGYNLPNEEIKQYRKLPQKKIETTESAIEYLTSRGISKEIVKKYRITTNKKNRDILVFPFFDEYGEMVCVKYRNTKYKKGENQNKEWFEKNTMPILFGIAQCEKFDKLIITEGQIDSLSIASCGIPNAVSVPTGASGFTWLSNCWDFVSKFEEIIVFGDCEKGTVTLYEPLRLKLKQKIKVVRIVDYLGEKDANAILTKYGKNAILKAIENAEETKIQNIKCLSEVRAVDLIQLEKIKTNIKEIDRVIGGFYHGQVVLLSGKRGNGKSTFMSQIVAESLNQNKNVFIYSGELSDFHFKRWLDFQLAGDRHIKITKNEYGDNIYSIPDNILDRISIWYKNRAFIYDNSYIYKDTEEEEELIETIEKVIKQKDIKLVCIDNLMTAMETDLGQNNLYIKQSNFVGKLKKIAIKYNVVVILVAHPRKNNAEFNNDDVSGSGDITNKVDVVMSYERVENDYYNGKLQVTKNRLTGKCATKDNAIELYYNESTKRITSGTNEIVRYGWEKEHYNIWENKSFNGWDNEDCITQQNLF